jgi:outer membrane protein assembly factor BamB
MCALTTKANVSQVCGASAQAGAYVFVAVAAALLLRLTLCEAAAPRANRAPPDLIAAQLGWAVSMPAEQVDRVSDLLLVGDRLLAVDGEMGEMSAFDRGSRRLLWRQHRSHPSVSVLGTTDILLQSNDRLVRIDARSGRTKWEYILRDGFFGDGGWVAVVGGLACAVYYSADQATGLLQGLNRTTVIDLREGKARSTRLPVVPLWFGLDSPPRALYEEPQPAKMSSLKLDTNPDVPGAPHSYAVGCVDLATGRRIWQTALGSISSRRRPDVRPPMSALGLVVFHCAGDKASAELSWLDLNSGNELRRDKMPLDPARLWPVVDRSHRGRRSDARAVLRSVRLLSLEGNALSLVHALPPHRVGWKVDLAGYVRKQLAQRPSSYWFCDADWPFAVLTLNRYEDGANAVLLVDLGNGAVCRVAADRDVLATRLDVTHRMLYVAVSDSVRAYRITPASPGSAQATHRRR